MSSVHQQFIHTISVTDNSKSIQTARLQTAAQNHLFLRTVDFNTANGLTSM
jgi:hypothetical protein